MQQAAQMWNCEAKVPYIQDGVTLVEMEKCFCPPCEDVFLVSRCIWSVDTLTALSISCLFKFVSSVVQRRCQNQVQNPQISLKTANKHQLFTAASTGGHRTKIDERTRVDNVITRKDLLWSQVNNYLLKMSRQIHSTLVATPQKSQNHLYSFS